MTTIRKRYFGLDFGIDNFPIVLGGKNESILIHKDDKDNGGYISSIEPTFVSSIKASDNKPFPGVGVVGTDCYYTEYQKFSIVNKGSQPIYPSEYSLNVNKTTHIVERSKIVESTEDDKYIVEYLIRWNNNGTFYDDGKLSIKADKNFLDKTKEVILPFENLNFEIKYEVINPGDPAKHYHGQDYTHPKAKDGIINFTFSIFGSKEKLSVGDEITEENSISTEIGIIVQTQDDTNEVTTLKQIICGYAGLLSTNLGDYSSGYDLNTVVYVTNYNDNSISDAFTNKNKLFKYGNVNSLTAAKGYYVDYYSEVPTTYSVYYWNGEVLVLAYSIVPHNKIDVYYTGDSNYGDFSIYTAISIYSPATDNIETLEDLLLNKSKKIYRANYGQNVISDGYYVTSLIKPTDVYAFANNSANGWTKTSVSERVANVCYSNIINDPLDPSKYGTEIQIYLNNDKSTTLAAAYINQDKLYADDACTTLAIDGYYINSSDSGQPSYYIYKFSATQKKITDRIPYTSFFLLNNTYFNLQACETPYSSAIVYSRNNDVTTIPLAFNSNTILYKDNTGTNMLDSGCYITNAGGATPSKPFIAYYFDNAQGKWTNSADCLLGETVYYSELVDERASYNDASIFLDKNYSTLAESIQHKIYEDENGTTDVPDGYYSVIDPTLDYSYTAYHYINGVPTEIIRHLKQVGGGQIFFSTNENSGCFGVYTPKTVFAYDESVTEQDLSGVKNNHLSLYQNESGTLNAEGGYYAVATPVSYATTLVAPYTWYMYNVYTKEITQSYDCAEVIYEYPVWLFTAVNNVTHRQTSSGVINFYTLNPVSPGATLLDLVKSNRKIFNTREGNIDALDGKYFVETSMAANAGLEAVHAYQYSTTYGWNTIEIWPDISNDIFGEGESWRYYDSIALYCNPNPNADPDGSPNGYDINFYDSEVRLYSERMTSDEGVITLKKIFETNRGLYVEPTLNTKAAPGFYKELFGVGSDKWYFWNGSEGWGAVPAEVYYTSDEDPCLSTNWSLTTIYFRSMDGVYNLASALASNAVIYTSETLAQAAPIGYYINKADFDDGKQYLVYEFNGATVNSSSVCMPVDGDAYSVQGFYYKSVEDSLCDPDSYDKTPSPVYCMLIEALDHTNDQYDRNYQPTIFDLGSDTEAGNTRFIYTSKSMDIKAPAGIYYDIANNFWFRWDPVAIKGWTYYYDCSSDSGGDIL